MTLKYNYIPYMDDYIGSIYIYRINNSMIFYTSETIKYKSEILFYIRTDDLLIIFYGKEYRGFWYFYSERYICTYELHNIVRYGMLNKEIVINLINN